MSQTKQRTKEISIPVLHRSQFTVTIEGIGTLLTNAWTDEAISDIEDKQGGKAQGPRQPRDPEKEWVSHIHRTEDDKPAFPACGIKKSCVEACRYLPTPMTYARGMFYILGDLLPIDSEEPHLRRDMGKIRGRQGTSGMPIYRPEYPLPWSITFEVLHDPNIASMESIVNLIQVAGFHVGIGSHRPACGGSHGMFQVRGTQVRRQNEYLHETRAEA